MSVCSECGAPIPRGATCLTSFHALLALEWEISGGPGEVAHFFAVATYGLQHPDSMGYGREAFEGLQRAVRDVLGSRASIAKVRARVRHHVAAAGRVTRRDGDPVPLPLDHTWPIVVSDVVAGGTDGYAERVELWARSVVERLDARDAG